MSDENTCETTMETASAVSETSDSNQPVENESNQVQEVNKELIRGCEGTVIRNVENNESFRSLLVYDSDSSSSSDIHIDWRETKDESEDSSSSSSSDEGELCLNSPINRGAIRKKKAPSLDMSLDELPPIPDLSKLDINVGNEEILLMGHIMGIINKLVTVEAIPNSPAYDLDTLLFLNNGRTPLGYIFDVLGQITSPIYAIRFNSIEDIEKLKITVGTKVYCAPTNKHTQYVFVQQLLKMKGSDASWLNDRECPQDFADFSDDETERHLKNNTCPMELHKKRHYQEQQQQHHQQREMLQHKKFETTMNKRNLLNTKFNKYVDSYRQSKLVKRYKKKANDVTATTTSATAEANVLEWGANVPKFDPRVPPPALFSSTNNLFYTCAPPITYLPPEFLSSSSSNVAYNNNNLNNRYLETEFNGNNNNLNNDCNNH